MLFDLYTWESEITHVIERHLKKVSIDIIRIGSKKETRIFSTF